VRKVQRLGWLSLAAAAAFAGQDEDRARLLGKWQSSGGESWTIARDGDLLRLTSAQNGRQDAEFRCNTVGKECEAKESGKAVKITMWFNGPKLVITETRGSDVVKKRFQATGDGNAMEVETLPIVPEGKPETTKMTRSGDSKQ
jgi:hypothetical protein